MAIEVSFEIENTLKLIYNDVFRKGANPLALPFIALFEMIGDKARIPLDRDYNEFLFGDFIDFIDETERQYEAELFKENYLYLYNLLEEDNPLGFSTVDGDFYITGIAIRREMSVINIIANIVPIGDQSEKIRALCILGNIQDGKFIEKERSLVGDHLNHQVDKFIYHNAGFLTDNYISKLTDKDILRSGEKELEYFTRINDFNKNMLFNIYGFIFNLLPRFLLLPQYFDFMYDLVITEKRPVRSLEDRIIRKHGKTKKGSPIIYKIIKSINVHYLYDKTITTRKYTPPSHSFQVNGHWRTLPNPDWKGRDQFGDEVIGKTWVHDFVKGHEQVESNNTIETKTEQIVIKIKQPLEYAKSKIQASTKTIKVDIDKPSEEWMYEERKKLTSALRYKILKRDNYRCQLCGAVGTDKDVQIEVDHKIPISKWGKTEESNLWTLCKKCNRGKSKEGIY